jgi:hypothetical protein
MGRRPQYIPAVGRRGELAIMTFAETDEIIRSMSNRT